MIENRGLCPGGVSALLYRGIRCLGSATYLALWEAPYDHLKIKRVDGSIVPNYDFMAQIILAGYF